MTPERTYRYEHQRRAAQNQRDAERRAEAERRRAECGTAQPHYWNNWEYAADYATMTRVCRECGETETRPVRL